MTAAFRIHPGAGTPKRYRHNPKPYFTIHCFATKKEMTEEVRKMNNGNDKGYAALTQPQVTYTKTKKGKWKPKNHCLGFVAFCKQRCGGGVIAHESLHIALCFLRAQHHSEFQLTDAEHIDDTEEELGYVLWNVVRRITTGFYKYKIYT